MRHCDNNTDTLDESIADAELKKVNGEIPDLDDIDIEKNSSGPCHSLRHGPWGGCISVSGTPTNFACLGSREPPMKQGSREPQESKNQAARPLQGDRLQRDNPSRGHTAMWRYQQPQSRPHGHGEVSPMMKQPSTKARSGRPSSHDRLYHKTCDLVEISTQLPE